MHCTSTSGACLLAAVCEVYAGPVWASSATFYAVALAVFYGRTSLGIIGGVLNTLEVPFCVLQIINGQ